jgi:hypothetical protein
MAFREYSKEAVNACDIVLCSKYTVKSNKAKITIQRPCAHQFELNTERFTDKTQMSFAFSRDPPSIQISKIYSILRTIDGWVCFSTCQNRLLKYSSFCL